MRPTPGSDLQQAGMVSASSVASRDDDRFGRAIRKSSLWGDCRVIVASTRTLPQDPRLVSCAATGRPDRQPPDPKLQEPSESSDMCPIVDLRHVAEYAALSSPVMTTCKIPTTTLQFLNPLRYENLPNNQKDYQNESENIQDYDHSLGRNRNPSFDLATYP